MMKHIPIISSMIFASTLTLNASIVDAREQSWKKHYNPHHQIRKLNKKIKSNKRNIANNASNIQTNSDQINLNTDEIFALGNDFADLDARISTLENQIPANTTTINVDCSSETISNALNNASPIGHLTIEVSGSCSDNIIITRDNVALVGLNGASITYSAPVTDNENRNPISNIVTVIGGDNIVIKNLRLDGNNTANAALRLINNASVLLKDSTLENSFDNVWASNNSSLQMSGNTVQNSMTYGIVITDGAVLEMRENNNVTHSANTNAALGLYRNATARVRQGSNTITNTFTNGTAVDAYHGSQFRSDKGTLVINGRMGTGLQGQISLRDSIVNGRILVFNEGTLRIRPKSDVTVNGDIVITNAASTTISNDAGTTSINGNIICSGYNAAIFGSGNAVISGSTDLYSSCNL